MIRGAAAPCYAHIEYEEQCRLRARSSATPSRASAVFPLTRPIDVAAVARDGLPDAGPPAPARTGASGSSSKARTSCATPALTRQLLPDAVRAARELADRLAAAGLAEDADVELSENRAGDERAMHIELTRAGARGPVPPVEPIHGRDGALAGARLDGGRAVDVYGLPYVEDVVRGVRLRRHARAFFQGNRYLLDALVSAVIDACLPGPVVDLYAGVGLFGALRGRERPAPT